MKEENAVSRVLQSALLMDSAACALIAAGSAAALSHFTVWEGGVWVHLLTAAVAAAMTAAFSRRWWIAPLTAALAALSYAVIRLFWDTALVAFIDRYAEWLITGAVYVEDLTDPNFLTVSRSLTVLGVTLVLFFLIRKLFSFTALTALQIGVLVLPAVLRDADVAAPMCASAAGLIILLPRVYARRIAKQLPDVKARSYMQIVAVPAAVLAVLAGMLLTPEDASAWKSLFLNNLAEDAATLFGSPFDNWPGSASNFNLYRLGFQNDPEKLGGPVTLTDNKILSVASDRPVLLKGRVLDYYTGESWYMTAPDGNIRFNSFLLRGYKRDAFGLDKPSGGRDVKRLYDQLTVPLDIDVRHSDSRYNTLFAAGAVTGLKLNKSPRGAEPYFNMRAELYTRVRLPYDSDYTFKTRVWDTGARDFAPRFAELERLIEDSGAPDARYDAILTRCTQLPDSLPDAVRQTADMITNSIESPYGKAAAVSRWLADNFEYTLEPEYPPDGADFTAWFLESGEGYCVYYATAMTVLARCAGLPARYVQGFALEHALGADWQYRATGRTAHAWSEVYFKGLGWIPFDPLSWDASEPLNEEIEQPETEPTPAATGSSLTPSESEQEEQGGYEEDAETAAPEEERRPVWVIPAVILLLALAMSVIPATRWAMGRKARLWSPERVRRRYPEDPARMDALYADTLRLLELCGLPPMPGETLVTFPERVDLHIIEGSFRDSVAEAVSRMKYANIPPTSADVERACQYHALLESHVRELLGKQRYLFKRALR